MRRRARIGVLGRAKHRRGIQVSAPCVMAPIAHHVAATGDVRATPTAQVRAAWFVWAPQPEDISAGQGPVWAMTDSNR